LALDAAASFAAAAAFSFAALAAFCCASTPLLFDSALALAPFFAGFAFPLTCPFEFAAMAAFSFTTLAVACASGAVAVTAWPASNSSTASWASAAAASPFAPLLAASLTPLVGSVSYIRVRLMKRKRLGDLQQQRQVGLQQRLYLHLLCRFWREQRQRVSLF
jgi:hypothetical protein